jgi:hypothetical protein
MRFLFPGFYFNELLIDVNWLFRLVPRPLTTAMIASAIPAAIKPYSIAVAPDSSDKNFKKLRFTCASVGLGYWFHPVNLPRRDLKLRKPG